MINFKNLIIILAMSTQTVFALNGLEIMQEVDNRSKQYQTQIADVTMKITQEDSTKNRYFKNIRKLNKTGLEKSLIRFYKPAKIKNTVLLTHKNEVKTQWLYLPAFKTINRINTKNQNNSFMGSDFSYADIAGRKVNEDTHTKIKEDAKYFYVQSIPKSKEDIYSKIELIISKKLYIPLRVTFYNKDNQRLKRLTNKKIENFGVMNLVTIAEMKNYLRNSKTKLEISDVIFDKPVSDNEVGLRGIQ